MLALRAQANRVIHADVPSRLRLVALVAAVAERGTIRICGGQRSRGFHAMKTPPDHAARIYLHIQC